MNSKEFYDSLNNEQKAYYISLIDYLLKKISKIDNALDRVEEVVYSSIKNDSETQSMKS